MAGQGINLGLREMKREKEKEGGEDRKGKDKEEAKEGRKMRREGRRKRKTNSNIGMQDTRSTLWQAKGSILGLQMW
jgi:hypothetical protein